METRAVVRIVAPLVAGLALSGCNTAATIHQHGDVRTEAEIIGSDSSAIYVKTENGKDTIPRRTVVDIDHPGRSNMIAGVIAAIAGLTVGVHAGTQWQDTPEAERVPLYAEIGIGTALLVTGTGMALWGADVHAESKQKSYPNRQRWQDNEEEARRLDSTGTPVAKREAVRPWGLGMSLEF
jgi:hypothetical protein